MKKKDYINLLFSILSAFVSAFAYRNFLTVGGFYPSGFSGISTILSNVTTIPFSIYYFALNIIITFFVFKQIGKKFAIFSVVQFTLMSILLPILPRFYFTDNLLLLSIFGGLINGFGTGLALSHNSSSGGFDFISIYYSNKYRKSCWSYILVANVIILVIAGYVSGFEIAMYSIIMQFVQTQVYSTMHKRYTHKTLYIVTKHKDEVIKEILSGTRHGITVLEGKGAYLQEDVSLLLTVVNSFQVNDVINAAKKADPKVFINITDSEGISGNYYQLPLD